MHATVYHWVAGCGVNTRSLVATAHEMYILLLGRNPSRIQVDKPNVQFLCEGPARLRV